MQEQIDNYTADIDPTHWAAIAAFVRASVRNANPATARQTKFWLQTVAALSHWCWLLGEPLERERAFSNWTIERFIADVGTRRWSPTSRATHRAALFTVAERLLGQEARTPRLNPVPRSVPNAPYSKNEMTALRSWARSQSTASKRRNAIVLLALAAGAGLTTEDLLSLNVRDLESRDGGVLVSVSGRRPRVVPMLDSWSADLLAAIDGMPADDLVFRTGRTGSSGRAVTNFLGRTTGPLKPTTHRLRVTWIVHHLTVGTNVRALLAASGAQSFEALARLVPYVPEVAADEAIHQLRGLRG